MALAAQESTKRMRKFIELSRNCGAWVTCVETPPQVVVSRPLYSMPIFQAKSLSRGRNGSNLDEKVIL